MGTQFVALAVVALALAAPQAGGQRTEAQRGHSNTRAATGPGKHSTNAANGDRQGCPGTQYPRLSCEALSAQADLEQARAAQGQAAQSVRQGNLFRTEIVISGLTMAAAFAAAAFAAGAASAARATVKAFVEVERADIVMTLENFKETPEGLYDPNTGTFLPSQLWVNFDVIANNIGRSSALITHVAHAWHKAPNFDEGGAMVGPPKTYIVKAGNSTKVELMGGLVSAESLKERRFLWLLVSYKAPLCDDQQVLRICFEVFGVHSNIPYKEAKRDYWKQAVQAPHSPEPGWRGWLERHWPLHARRG